MCDRNEVFAALCSGMAHHSSDSVQQLTQKDKVLWKGASRGSVQEQGLSTPSVTLVSLQIGFVLVNEGERKEEKKAHEQEKGKKKTVLLWLMSGSPPATQAMFMPSGVGSNLGWLCVFFFSSFCLLTLFSRFLCFLMLHSWLTQVLNTGWKQKLVGGI